MSHRVRSSARRLTAAVVAAITVTAVAPTASAGGPPPAVLDQDMRGEQAIRALGDRLPAVAAQNRSTPAEFRAHLREDPMLWVSRTGQLLFVDEFAGHAPGEVTGTDVAATTTAPLSETFALHSRPGAPRVVFLDFDGHDARGTAWGSTSAQIAGAYDADGDPSSFSDAERTTIQDIWRRVAEDFAPLDIDVTTADPGASAIRRDSTDDPYYGSRLVITPSKPYNCSCGGVAYVGVFDMIGSSHDYYQPAWVFTAGVGTGAKSVAEAASHEIGHNLGLSHDGGAGTGYYQGHGDWAPIMGVGYYRPITQWSRGEYSGATELEDDFQVMQSHGAPVVVDDHGGTASTATPLGTAPVAGTIATAADVDAFSFSTTGGTVSLDAVPAPSSPNLDISLRLLDGTGVQIASADPSSAGSVGPDLTDGMAAGLSLPLAAGSYTVVVDGVGHGDPGSTGYSGYGSLGRYTLTGSIVDNPSPPPPDEEPPPPDDPVGPPLAPTSLAATVANGTVTLSWTDNSTDETHFELVRESLHKNGSWRGTTVESLPAGTSTVVDSPGTGTFRYWVRAVNAQGTSADSNIVRADVSGSTSGGGGGNGGGKRGLKS